MVTKNNPKNRSKIQKKKHNNKEIDSVLYDGHNIGHGKYMTGKYSGSNQLVSDENGRPIPWNNII